MKRWERSVQAVKLHQAQAALSGEVAGSQRQVAEQLGVPRSTLQHWRQRQARLEAEPAVVRFFESPEGLMFLHRLQVAAHVVIALSGSGGIRQVRRLLELSGVDRFIASSYSAQRRVGAAVETETVDFGQRQRACLAEAMPARRISVCQDETFHPEPCLVAIEPVSNFILLERYAPNRTAGEWDAAMAQALEGLPVEVVQSTSDQARAIRCHVEKSLGAHPSPDLFHVQQDLVKGTGSALQARLRRADEALLEASTALERLERKPALDEGSDTDRCSPPDRERALERAQWRVAAAELAFEQAQAQRTEARESIRTLNRAYHPYDLNSARPRSRADVQRDLEQAFDRLEKLAATASLSQRCCERIAKARRVLNDMLATVSFFILTVTARIEALELPPDVEHAVFNQLIPALYLRRVAEKTETADERRRLRQRAADLLAALNAPGAPLSGLPHEDSVWIEQVATDCADLFQRSSSCVEGRNGQLALHHHHLHRLRPRKLAALTTVHNYFIQRSDGTTPAERFFGRRPDDLFEWLLDRVPMPARPARKRASPTTPEPMLRAAP